MSGVYAGAAITSLFGDLRTYRPNNPISIPVGFSLDSDKIKATFQAARTYLRPIASTMGQTKRWTVIHTQVDLGGSVTGNEVVEFVTTANSTFAGLYLEWALQSTTTTKVRLGRKTVGSGRVNLGTSDTTFDEGTPITIRIGTDGTSIEIWIQQDGDLLNEIDVSESDQWSILFLVSPDDADFTHWWWDMIQRGGSSGTDRPGTDVEGFLLYPIDDDYTGEYGYKANCNLNTGTFTYWDEIDDDGDSPNDDVDYTCEEGGATGKILSLMSDSSAASAGTGVITRTPDGVTSIAFGAASLNAKTVDSDSILKSTSEDIVANVNMSGTGFFCHGHDWPDPPDGSWGDYVHDPGAGDIFNHASASRQLKGGVQSPDTNTANDWWTTFNVFCASVNDDPEEVEGVPAHAYDYRRRRVTT